MSAREVRERSDAHELQRRLTREPTAPPPIVERAKADETVRRFLRAEDVDRLLDPMSYVRAAAEKTDRILAGIDRATAA